MKKLVIFATLEVQPGTRDAAVKVLLEHRARACATNSARSSSMC